MRDTRLTKPTSGTPAFLSVGLGGLVLLLILSRPPPAETMGIAEALPEALITAIRERGGSSASHGVIGLILCLLSSVPLSQLSRKAASLFAVVLTALLAFMQRLLRSRSGEITEQHERLVIRDPDGNRHEVVFLGDAHVGKSSLLTALRAHIPPHMREIASGSNGSIARLLDANRVAGADVSDDDAATPTGSADGSSSTVGNAKGGVDDTGNGGGAGSSSSSGSGGSGGNANAGVRQHAVIVWVSTSSEKYESVRDAVASDDGLCGLGR